MNFFFNDIIESLNCRKTQLSKQKNNDIILEKLNKKCPNDVFIYLLNDRELNRKLISKFNNSNIYDLIRITKYNIDITKKEINTFNSNVCNCETLKKYNKEFIKRIYDI